MAKKTKPAFHRLSRLTAVGGFMDGVDIEFAPGLNCIIGGRGTGKTTLLEFARYALDLVRDDTNSRRSTQGLIDHNLGGGRIRLTIETRDGLTYIVSRTAGEDPVVLDSKGNPTDISLSSGGLFGADIYSQNDIEGIADDPLSQLALIDNFETDTIRADDLEIQRTLSALKSNAHECAEAQKVIAGLADELNTLKVLEAKLKEFKATSGEDADAVNKAHEQKAQRDREKRAITAALESLAEYSEDIKGLVGRVEQDMATIFDHDTVAGLNADAMKALLDILLECGRDADRLLGEAEQRVKAGANAFSEEVDKLAVVHKKQDMSFDSLIEKHKEAMGQSAERAALEKRRNEILTKKKVHDQKSKELKVLLKEREALLAKLSELRNHRFATRKGVAERINAEVSPQIQVRVEQYGNTQNYQALLEAGLKNAGVRHRVVAGKIAGCISPQDFAKAIRQGDIDVIVDRAEVSPDQARKIITTLSGDPVLYDFETVELIDLPCIELLDGGEYKNSLMLSTGQKCTSILPILLLDSEKPLLVDQPEDNLDNRFVFTTVVQRIQEVKRNRQLIFITHNPNIPVLGEADKVFVLNSTGQSATVEREGAVDACKEEIVTILEGGEDAFKERRRRYNY